MGVIIDLVHVTCVPHNKKYYQAPWKFLCLRFSHSYVTCEAVKVTSLLLSLISQRTMSPLSYPIRNWKHKHTWLCDKTENARFHEYIFQLKIEQYTFPWIYKKKGELVNINNKRIVISCCYYEYIRKITSS